MVGAGTGVAEDDLPALLAHLAVVLVVRLVPIPFFDCKQGTGGQSEGRQSCLLSREGTGHLLLYDTVKETRKAFRLRPLLLRPPTSLSLSTTVHLCTQHHLTSVSLSLSTLYHPLVPSGSQWRMPEPGEVAREASQRNLPRYQRHQLQTHHARVTRPRRRTPPPGTTLLFLGAHWRRGRSSLNSAPTGRGRERQGLASTRTAHLNAQLCYKVPARTSNLLLLQHAAGAA